MWQAALFRCGATTVPMNLHGAKSCLAPGAHVSTIGQRGRWPEASRCLTLYDHGDHGRNEETSGSCRFHGCSGRNMSTSTYAARVDGVWECRCPSLDLTQKPITSLVLSQWPSRVHRCAKGDAVGSGSHRTTPVEPKGWRDKTRTNLHGPRGCDTLIDLYLIPPLFPYSRCSRHACREVRRCGRWGDIRCDGPWFALWLREEQVASDSLQCFRQTPTGLDYRLGG
ncbi:hypothetical protein BT67DRAFT_102052 [Trichocladium antarcticum]|uniref:Uncharacterized protein n=1 Tax=Trichocladium antarcticum TaxID=1450529 RepID=A0AAN6UQW5_9PEZI|nr:hypothetical protein BT67DRAFT_102052 [Trichocladium antarcticum]